MDLAGQKREVDTTKRFDAAEALRDALQFNDGLLTLRHGEFQIRK
jgi:hypothetical protein